MQYNYIHVDDSGKLFWGHTQRSVPSEKYYNMDIKKKQAYILN